MAGAKRARAPMLPSKIRHAFDQAVRDLASGKTSTTITLKEIWIEMITQDPFKAFDTLSKFCPKEMLIEQDVRHHFISGEPISVDEWEATYLADAQPVEQLEH